MNRAQLEHVIRAAATIAGDTEIVVIGSREKDRDYVRTAARHRLADRQTLLERLARTPVDEEQRNRLAKQIEADFSHY